MYEIGQLSHAEQDSQQGCDPFHYVARIRGHVAPLPLEYARHHPRLVWEHSSSRAGPIIAGKKDDRANALEFLRSLWPKPIEALWY